MDNKQKDKKFKNIFSFIFIVGLIASIILLDRYLMAKDFVSKSTIFMKNDFEKIRLSHPEKVYNKVFYGNSVVISAFRENDSNSGYINMGMDYATVSDLYKILDKKMIEIGSELVIGINYLSFLDTFDTNPTYPWHKKDYEPYLYFQRDRIYKVLTTGIENILKGEKFITQRYTDLNRYLYYEVLPDEELDKKIENYKKLYWNKGLEYYEQNFKDFQKIIDYCKEKNIRLRVVILPWNSYIEKPENVVAVETKAKEILDKNNIEYINYEGKFLREHFYDLGHLNWGVGAVEFTKEIDIWLNQE